MLATNIESKVRFILEKNSERGWLRTSKCAKLYADGNVSEETRFYRWRKQVEKGKVPGFQVVKLPGNVSFIGLDSADPKVIESFVSNNKRTSFGLFDWLDRRAERKRLEREKIEKKHEIHRRTSLKLLAKQGEGFEIFGEIADIEDKERKKLEKRKTRAKS